MKFTLKILMILSCLAALAAPLAYAQQIQENEDITSSNFTLTVCNGPENGAHIKSDGTYDPGYVNTAYKPCNFAAALRLVQHLMNIMVIFGVVIAIGGFCYTGFLYIVRGSESKARSDASEVFKKVFIGFIIMLTAWFIVYQILSWAQCGGDSANCNKSGTSLLKNS